MINRFILAGSIASLMFAPDNGGNGGGGKNLTLEEQLTAVRAELATAQASAATLPKLTADLAAANANAATLQTQFDALSGEATKAKTDLAAAQGQVIALTSERDTERTAHTATQGSVTRLETLCGVKGISTSAAPGAADDPSGNGAHVYDQWSKSEGAEKSRLWSAHRDEIRAEGERRAKGR